MFDASIVDLHIENPLARRRGGPGAFLSRTAEACCLSPRQADAEGRARLHAARKTPLSCGNRPGTSRKADPEKTPGDRYTAHSYGRAIQYSSRPGENVPDLFDGSGSRLTACQRTDRRAYLMELGPLHCDVIVQRWRQFTGEKAKRVPAPRVKRLIKNRRSGRRS